MQRRRERGLSLVELMVSLVVALLVGLAAAGSAIFFTATQRQSLAAGAVATNITTTLSAIKEDVSQAGLGFFGESQLLCSHLNLSLGTANHAIDGFSPVQVSRGADFDRLEVVHASDVAAGANVRLQGAAAGAGTALKSFLPVSVGNAVLLAPEPGTPDPRCTVRSVTGVTAATPTPLPSPQVVAFDLAGEHNQVAFAAAMTYGTDARMALLGRLTWHRYRVDGSDLVMDRVLQNESAVLVRNVVGFRVQYGITEAPSPLAPNPTTVTAWQNAAAAWGALTPASLPRVRAVRIGIVSRSPQAEKRDAAGNCVATAEVPALFGEAVTALPVDWQCFRYRSSVVTVPLRNVVMGLT